MRLGFCIVGGCGDGSGLLGWATCVVPALQSLLAAGQRAGKGQLSADGFGISFRRGTVHLDGKTMGALPWRSATRGSHAFGGRAFVSPILPRTAGIAAAEGSASRGTDLWDSSYRGRCIPGVGGFLPWWRLECGLSAGWDRLLGRLLVNLATVLLPSRRASRLGSSAS